MIDERRRAERHRIGVRIDLAEGSGHTLDISGLGVLFQTEIPLETGDPIDFTLVLPRAGNVRCRGRVVRIVAETAGVYAVAATIDRYRLPEEGASADNIQDDPILERFRLSNPEGWEWGE